jgi:hypothetical protein
VGGERNFLPHFFLTFHFLQKRILCIPLTIVRKYDKIHKELNKRRGKNITTYKIKINKNDYVEVLASLEKSKIDSRAYVSEIPWEVVDELKKWFSTLPDKGHFSIESTQIENKFNFTYFTF